MDLTDFEFPVSELLELLPLPEVISTGSEMEGQMLHFLLPPFCDLANCLCCFCSPPGFCEVARVVGVHDDWSKCTTLSSKGCSHNCAYLVSYLDFPISSWYCQFSWKIAPLIQDFLTIDRTEWTGRNRIQFLSMVGSDPVFGRIGVIAGNTSRLRIGLWTFLHFSLGAQLNNKMINVHDLSDHA